MLKHLTLLLALLLAVGTLSTPVLAQDEGATGTQSSEAGSDKKKPAEGEAEPECD